MQMRGVYGGTWILFICCCLLVITIVQSDANDTPKILKDNSQNNIIHGREDEGGGTNQTQVSSKSLNAEDNTAKETLETQVIGSSRERESKTLDNDYLKESDIKNANSVVIILDESLMNEEPKTEIENMIFGNGSRKESGSKFINNDGLYQLENSLRPGQSKKESFRDLISGAESVQQVIWRLKDSYDLDGLTDQIFKEEKEGNEKTKNAENNSDLSNDSSQLIEYRIDAPSLSQKLPLASMYDKKVRMKLLHDYRLSQSAPLPNRIRYRLKRKPSIYTSKKPFTRLDIGIPDIYETEVDITANPHKITKSHQLIKAPEHHDARIVGYSLPHHPHRHIDKKLLPENNFISLEALLNKDKHLESNPILDNTHIQENIHGPQFDPLNVHKNHLSYPVIPGSQTHLNYRRPVSFKYKRLMDHRFEQNSLHDVNYNANAKTHENKLVTHPPSNYLPPNKDYLPPKIHDKKEPGDKYIPPTHPTHSIETVTLKSHKHVEKNITPILSSSYLPPVHKKIPHLIHNTHLGKRTTHAENIVDISIPKVTYPITASPSIFYTPPNKKYLTPIHNLPVSYSPHTSKNSLYSVIPPLIRKPFPANIPRTYLASQHPHLFNVYRQPEKTAALPGWLMRLNKKKVTNPTPPPSYHTRVDVSVTAHEEEYQFAPSLKPKIIASDYVTPSIHYEAPVHDYLPPKHNIDTKIKPPKDTYVPPHDTIASVLQPPISNYLPPKKHAAIESSTLGISYLPPKKEEIIAKHAHLSTTYKPTVSTYRPNPVEAYLPPKGPVTPKPHYSTVLTPKQSYAPPHEILIPPGKEYLPPKPVTDYSANKPHSVHHKEEISRQKAHTPIINKGYLPPPPPPLHIPIDLNDLPPKVTPKVKGNYKIHIEEHEHYSKTTVIPHNKVSHALSYQPILTTPKPIHFVTPILTKPIYAPPVTPQPDYGIGSTLSPPLISYIPPIKPHVTYVPPTKPQQVYIHPVGPETKYTPPIKPEVKYIPPIHPIHPSNIYVTPRPIHNEHVHGKSPIQAVRTHYVTPKPNDYHTKHIQTPTYNSTLKPIDYRPTLKPGYIPPAKNKDPVNSNYVPPKTVGYTSHSSVTTYKPNLPEKYKEIRDFSYPDALGVDKYNNPKKQYGVNQVTTLNPKHYPSIPSKLPPAPLYPPKLGNEVGIYDYDVLYYDYEDLLNNDYYYDYLYDYLSYPTASRASPYQHLLPDYFDINEDLIHDYGYIAGVPGRAGRDYPILSYIPKTTFACELVADYPGYYADMEAGCQVFHICHRNGRQDSFLCPNGTVFNQKYFVCDWWYNFPCEDAPFFYPVNAVIGHPQVQLHRNSFDKGISAQSNYYNSHGVHPHNYHGKFMSKGLIDLVRPSRNVFTPQKNNYRSSIWQALAQQKLKNNILKGMKQKQTKQKSDQKPIEQMMYYHAPELGHDGVVLMDHRAALLPGKKQPTFAGHQPIGAGISLPVKPIHITVSTPSTSEIHISNEPFIDHPSRPPDMVRKGTEIPITEH